MADAEPPTTPPKEVTAVASDGTTLTAPPYFELSPERLVESWEGLMERFMEINCDPSSFVMTPDDACVCKLLCRGHLRMAPMQTSMRRLRLLASKALQLYDAGESALPERYRTLVRTTRRVIDAATTASDPKESGIALGDIVPAEERAEVADMVAWLRAFPAAVAEGPVFEWDKLSYAHKLLVTTCRDALLACVFVCGRDRALHRLSRVVDLLRSSPPS